MTDENPTNPFSPKKRGWPKGKPRKVAAEKPAEKPVVEKPAAVPARTPLLTKMKALPNWNEDTEGAVGDEGVDRLRIPPDIVQMLAADGVALQWITKSIRGMETPQELAKFTKGGWTPVHQADFDGVLDGMFMPKGVDDVIVVDDCMLVARPMAIQRRARQREREQAREPLMIKQAELGQGIPVTGGDHPSARAQNRINITRERIEIPE